MPHCVSINRAIKDGDVLVTGAGADIGGYGSELERTMIVGEPTEKQAKMFDAMMRAQDASIEALKPGNTCADVDKASRKVFIGRWLRVPDEAPHGPRHRAAGARAALP